MPCNGLKICTPYLLHQNTGISDHSSCFCMDSAKILQHRHVVMAAGEFLEGC